ncbi:uncharacterized protein [Dysidea avara]|uniref:uncharacterized protein n=1 Tax=Dysidea avara TaxID=196820 RepID=UPI003326053B
MDSSAPKYGYPVPGKQNTTPQEVMTQMFFVHDDKWERICQSGEFDYVIIGSSYCALGFITKVAENNPKAKLLVLEQGQYFHPTHFQNLPPAYIRTWRGASETFPWSISEKTHQGKYIKWQHGMNNFLGGRSLFWNGWTPEPTDEEMEHWPPEVIDTVHKYFGEVRELLNVVSADEIFVTSHPAKPVYGKLQKALQLALSKVSDNVDTITRMIPGPLAVKSKSHRYQDFEKHAVPDKLLDIILSSADKAPLKIRINCTVKKIQQDGKKATVLETSQGNFKLGNAKLVLAMGTLPPTTLMLNSFPKSQFPQLVNIGKRYTCHFITNVTARLPRSILDHKSELGDLEMAAIYMAGVSKKSNHQFHIQMAAISDTDPVKNAKDVFQFYLVFPNADQLSASTKHVIIACSTLGQLDHHNKENWYRLNDGNDVTTNATLQSVTNKTDEELWDAMDDATFQVIEQEIASGENYVEYWHREGSSGSWKKTRPTAEMIRGPATVHEASTMWMGGDDDKEAPVCLDYRPKGVENVYITGASLYPTGASWNPTGVMVALAMHLGDILEPKK